MFLKTLCLMVLLFGSSFVWGKEVYHVPPRKVVMEVVGGSTVLFGVSGGNGSQDKKIIKLRAGDCYSVILSLTFLDDVNDPFVVLSRFEESSAGCVEVKLKNARYHKNDKEIVDLRFVPRYWGEYITNVACMEKKVDGVIEIVGEDINIQSFVEPPIDDVKYIFSVDGLHFVLFRNILIVSIFSYLYVFMVWKSGKMGSLMSYFLHLLLFIVIVVSLNYVSLILLKLLCNSLYYAVIFSWVGDFIVLVPIVISFVVLRYVLSFANCCTSPNAHTCLKYPTRGE
jgi:hypothetical protein